MTTPNPRSTMLARSALLVTLLLSSPSHAQLPAPQIIMHGQATRAASLHADPSQSRAIYVFWDASEGRLEDLLPANASLTLTRDGVVVAGPFGRSDVASVAEIAQRYAALTEARRQAETLQILDLAFEQGPGQSLAGLPDDVDPTPLTFASTLHQVLQTPGWDPVTRLLLRLDPNVAFAARRGWVEPVTPTTPASVTFRLLMTTPGQAQPTELGRVQIDTTRDYEVGAPSRLAAVTDGLFRCDSNDWSRAHGAVALTWDHPGLQNQASYLDALLASIPIAGYDLFAKAGVCDPAIDLSALAAQTPFGLGGAVNPSGWRKVNERLAVIQSPAPLRVPDTSPEYVSTWQPRFAQTLELPATLEPLGLLPGAPICYAVVARDRTGNYGATASLQAVVGDFQPPEIPWNVSVVTVSKLDYADSGVLVDEKALAIEWPHVGLDNWLWSFASTYTPCNEVDARSGPRPGRLTIAETPAACSDPKRRAEVNVAVAEYLVYRFESAHVANAFSDADGDGLADADERLYDLDGDRVGDTPESSIADPKDLGTLPASDPALACEPDPSPGPSLVARIPASAAVASEDGRMVLRWQDTKPTADLGEAYWYRVAARSANGRLSRLAPPVRAAFYDMTKPPPFELGPGGDAGFFACEPTAYQDDSPVDTSRDGFVDPDELFSPVTLSLPPLEDGGRLRPRRVMGVDLSGEAAMMRVTCIDTELEKRAADSNDPIVQREATAMRLAAYVGTFTEASRLNSDLRSQLLSQTGLLEDELSPETRVILADGPSFEGLCSALTEKAYTVLFRLDGDGFGSELVQTCTPHVEFLDARGRPLAPAAPVEIRVDGSINAVDGASCSANPFAPGCLEYACNFTATLAPEVCERRLDAAPGLVTGKVKVRSRLDKGECAYLEAMQEFPVVDGEGKTTFELQPYRVGWECCDKDATCNATGGTHCCEVEQEIDTGDFGADQTCYSVTRVHNTAAGAPNTLAATRTGGPCIKRALPPSLAKPPGPPRLTELATEATRVDALLPPCAGSDCPCSNATEVFIEDRCVPRAQVAALLWASPETPTAGIVLEYYKEGGTAKERLTRFISSRGRYGSNHPKTDAIDLFGALPANTIERWCVTARSVGIAAPNTPEAQVSPPAGPLCVERRPAGVALPQYMPWPTLPRAAKLGDVKVEYLAADGIPFASIAALTGTSLPTRSGDAWQYDTEFPDFDDLGCERASNPPDCGCRPARACEPSNPENECLARPSIFRSEQNPFNYSVDQDVYVWPPNHAEVHSRCYGFCSEIAQKNTFTRVVAYRRSRDTSAPSQVGPFVQVSEYIPQAHCFFSRQQFRQWRPLVSRDPRLGGSRFGPDDPNFAVLDMQRSGAADRSMELVWLDRHPHMVGRDYQYHFVFFDERGEIRGYKESNWILYRQSGTPALPRHTWVPEDAP